MNVWNRVGPPYCVGGFKPNHAKDEEGKDDENSSYRNFKMM